MTRISVPTHSRLAVSYTFHEAGDPQSGGVIVLHHGICHTREHFLPLIAQLNQRGIHAAMIEQQSEQTGCFRNCIGPRQYREGMATAVRAIQRDCERRGLGIGSYVLHSMGAMIGEEMQQEHPDLRRPTVLMAPIPVHGAWPATWRIMRDQKGAYLRALLTADIHCLARKPDQVRLLFFDAKTPEHIVESATKQLKHAPIWMYFQLVLRPLVPWRRIVNDNLPERFLLYSETDYLFQAEEFDRTRRLYRPLDESPLPGGHDFFIQYADDAANRIADFVHQFGRGSGP